MTVEFIIYSEPFSINSYHYRDKRHKTADARAWEAKIAEQLVKQHRLTMMADVWRKNGGYFVMHCTAMYLKNVFYTQSGQISGRTIDITNWEKPLQDMIFKFMDLNDKLVKKLISEKSVGEYPCMKIRLELHSDTESNVLSSATPNT